MVITRDRKEGYAKSGKIEHISDRLILRNSVFSRRSSQSRAQLNFENLKVGVTVDFYVLNLQPQQKETFKISVHVNYDQRYVGFQSMLISSICFLICMGCAIKVVCNCCK